MIIHTSSPYWCKVYYELITINLIIKTNCTKIVLEKFPNFAFIYYVPILGDSKHVTTRPGV
jgi:hypothetical protein